MRANVDEGAFEYHTGQVSSGGVDVSIALVNQRKRKCDRNSMEIERKSNRRGTKRMSHVGKRNEAEQTA